MKGCCRWISLAYSDQFSFLRSSEVFFYTTSSSLSFFSLYLLYASKASFSSLKSFNCAKSLASWTVCSWIWPSTILYSSFCSCWLSSFFSSSSLWSSSFSGISLIVLIDFSKLLSLGSWLLIGGLISGTLPESSLTEFAQFSRSSSRSSELNRAGPSS